MRFVSLVVAFCFSLNVMASTGTVVELEKTLDDYNYSLSVDWDQKDQAFYDAKTEQFLSSVERLIKDEGLSKSQIMTLVEKKVNNRPMIEAMKLKMSLLSKGSTVEDLTKMIKESSKEMYAQGASWNGEVVYTVSIVLLVAAIVGYSYYWDAHHECVKTESQYVCTSYNNCNTYGTTSSYNDPFYTGYCNRNLYTTCGFVDVCTEYVEK
jgi:hypothetical protein